MFFSKKKAPSTSFINEAAVNAGSSSSEHENIMMEMDDLSLTMASNANNSSPPEQQQQQQQQQSSPLPPLQPVSPINPTTGNSGATSKSTSTSATTSCMANGELLVCQPITSPRTTTTTKSGNKEEEEEETSSHLIENNNDTENNGVSSSSHHDDDGLQVGDHVYQWRSWMGIPGVFQHHGIVMDIIHGENDNNDNSDNDKKQRRKLIIADFSNVEKRRNQTTKKMSLTAATPDDDNGAKGETEQEDSAPAASQNKNSDKEEEKNNKHHETNKKVPPNTRRMSGLTQEGILRTYTDTDKWYKVEYEASAWKRAIYRAGTCTPLASDAVGLVLARVHFIIQHPELLPDYHVIQANCECVAVWCKTGQWCTLQASSVLEWTAAGQVKSSTTLAVAAAQAQVSVPAAGIWGWMGYTANVSWLSLHPMVLPALAGYAVIGIGLPTIVYANARAKWKETSEKLQTAFWDHALAEPDVFAECLTHWSDKT